MIDDDSRINNEDTDGTSGTENGMNEESAAGESKAQTETSGTPEGTQEETSYSPYDDVCDSDPADGAGTFSDGAAGGTSDGGSDGADGNDGSDDGSSKKKKKGKKKKKTVMIIVAVVVVVALFAVGIYGLATKIDSLISYAYGDSTEETEETDDTEYPTIGSTVDDTDDEEETTQSSSGSVVLTDVSEIVDAVMPSIVAITSTTYVESSDYYSYFFGSDAGTYEETGAGSGIIIEESDTELLIVTNNHVVEGADSLTIQFVDDESVEGYVKGTDAESDIAIVSVPLSDISESTLSVIKKATLGDSDEMEVGDGVIAIGNALGYGQSVTTGVISAVDREITIDEYTMTVLQTDAAINGGNSGGALINASGEVIGINCAKYSSSSYSGSASIEGMGFAIPISSATDIINELMNRETRTVVDEDSRGSLGIYGYDVTSDVAEYYSMPQGVYVTDVISGGAAEEAGIVATDIITAFDGQTVSSMESLQDMLTYYSEGETVTVTISYRDGRDYVEKDVEVTLSGQSILESETETETEASTSGINEYFGY